MNLVGFPNREEGTGGVLEYLFGLAMLLTLNARANVPELYVLGELDSNLTRFANRTMC
jgi:hypothetical protein